MMEYSSQNLLRVAKRFNNAKRPYLLVNPLQAKHIPARPSAALEMMEALGGRLAEKYPNTRLVIGFAETATAIGAAVAGCFGEDCVYLHTTREALPEVGEWVFFSEEHSHATEQKLCAGQLSAWLENTASVILVDDEISTGKTLRNLVRQLRERFPGLADKQLAAASLLSRVSEEDQRSLSAAGLVCEWLVKLPELDLTGAVEGLSVEEAPPVEPAKRTVFRRPLACGPLPDPRKGARMGAYRQGCGQLVRAVLEEAGSVLKAGSHVVVLGTEECMYPALALGKALEDRNCSVLCHATTRSPIGLCGAPGYPIQSGRKLRSFYGGGRDTYIYNLARCDVLLVVSDAPDCDPAALNQLAAAWEPYGYGTLIFVQGGQNVWYL